MLIFFLKEQIASASCNYHSVYSLRYSRILVKKEKSFCIKQETELMFFVMVAAICCSKRSN